MTFSDMRLAEPILRAVTAAGYLEPTPIQAGAIPPVMEGRDLLGSAQTGTGKTAAFALPILHRLVQSMPTPEATPIAPVATEEEPPRHSREYKRRNNRKETGRGSRGPIRALILSPTRELALQIGDSLRTYGCHTSLQYTVIVGGVGQYPQVAALRRGVDILVATPGRLGDLHEQGHIDLRKVEIFVLDEADRMLDMGFLPDVQRIIEELPQQRQTLMFSATMPGPIAKLAEGILSDPARVIIAPVKTTTELVTQSVCQVPKSDKTRLLTTILQSPEVTRTIVFTLTKHGADRVVRQLETAGFHADALHGNKSQNARQRTLAQFKSSRPPVLVATDVAARGIDVDNISHVINYDLPVEAETYVHRIGRTGRAGSTGIAISFCDPSERSLLRAIEREIRQQIPASQITVARYSEAPRAPSAAGDSRPENRFEERAPRTEQRSQERAPRPEERAYRSGRPGHSHGDHRHPDGPRGNRYERDRPAPVAAHPAVEGDRPARTEHHDRPARTEHRSENRRDESRPARSPQDRPANPEQSRPAHGRPQGDVRRTGGGDRRNFRSEKPREGTPVGAPRGPLQHSSEAGPRAVDPARPEARPRKRRKFFVSRDR